MDMTGSSCEWRVASRATAGISRWPSRANSLASRGRLLKWIVTRVLLQLVLLLRINKIVDTKSKLDHNIFYQLFYLQTGTSYSRTFHLK